MTTPAPSSPHDAVFRAIFSQPGCAVTLFRLALAPDIFRELDLATVAVHSTTFVDEELRGSASDLLLEAHLRSGEPVLVYLLVEHQSTVDPLMPFRVVRYVVRVWDTWRRANAGAKRLPAIVPLVVHQGAGPWDGPRTLADLIDLPPEPLARLAPQLPARALTIHDLGALSLEQAASIEGLAAARLALVLLLAVARGLDLLETYGRFVELLAELARSPGRRENLGLLVR